MGWLGYDWLSLFRFSLHCAVLRTVPCWRLGLGSRCFAFLDALCCVFTGLLYVSSAPTATLDPYIGGDNMGSSISLYCDVRYVGLSLSVPRGLLGGAPLSIVGSTHAGSSFSVRSHVRFASVMPLSMEGMVLRFWLSRLLAFLCLLTCTFALGFRLQKLLMFPLTLCIVLFSTTDSGLVLHYSLYDHLWPCHGFKQAVPWHPSALFSLRLALTCPCNYSDISVFVLRFLFVRA